MRLRSVAAATAAMCVVSHAAADTRRGVAREREQLATEREQPPAIVFGTPTNGGWLDRAELSATKLVVEIRGTFERGADVTLPFALPAGSRVTGMTVSLAGHTTRAEQIDANLARGRYDDIVHGFSDPALLEQTPAIADHDDFQLHVSPVTPKVHATVEVAIELPASAMIVVDPGERVLSELVIDGPGAAQRIRKLGAPRAFELTRKHERIDLATSELVPRPAVGDGTSLFVRDPTRPPVPWVTIGTVSHAHERRFQVAGEY